MPLPYDSKGPETRSPRASTVGRDPSYPDRARIDSDVRAFLRPVSTPWIVFDRDSRAEGGVDHLAKSALRVGAVFASTPSFRPEVIGGSTNAATTELAHANTVADPFRPGAVLAARSSVLASNGVFPKAQGLHDNPFIEPSSLTVASDVFAESSELAEPARKRGRLAIALGGCGGVVVAAAVVFTIATHKAPVSSSATATAMQAPAAAAVEAPPATIELPATPAVESAPAPAPATTESVAAKTDPKKRFGKLTLKADATHKVVWFDGKKMLGSGQRSFLVYCGMHTIAVSDKTDSKDVEIPCNGEYVVSK